MPRRDEYRGPQGQLGQQCLPNAGDVAAPTGDCDDAVKQKIAAKIINLARAGERNPDLLCERALKDIRGSQP
jgi:hypothetical protein